MSELPQIQAVQPRARDELTGAAHAVQANVAALATAAGRRTIAGASATNIQTPPPGPVRRFREMLIDWRVIRDYTDVELSLRLRQVWGEFTALCWLFYHADPHRPPPFETLALDAPLRCTGHVHDKLTEVQRGLWRLTHERRIRNDPDYRADPDFKREHDIALSIPLKVGGRPVASADEQAVFVLACEYAGMLAALRWSLDRRWTWEGAGIMEVGAIEQVETGGPSCVTGMTDQS